MPLRRFIRDGDDICDKPEFKSWDRNMLESGRMLGLLPIPHIGEGDRHFSLLGDIYPRAIIHKEGKLVPLYKMMMNGQSAEWLRTVRIDDLHASELDSVLLEVLLDLISWGVAKCGGHLLPSIPDGRSTNRLSASQLSTDA